MNHAADPAKREAILARIREFADWAEANPGVPILDWGHEFVYPADHAEVSEISVRIGEMPEEKADFYRVTKRFGAGVSYVAYAARQDAGVPA